MKDIPVYLEGKQIEIMEEVPHIVEKLYKKYRRIFSVKKVYHTRGKRVDMENKHREAYNV